MWQYEVEEHGDGDGKVLVMMFVVENNVNPGVVGDGDGNNKGFSVLTCKLSFLLNRR